MKYAFRLTEAGPKTQAPKQWGLPLNLQICAKCGALNAKMATICSKCAQPLTAAGASTDTTATSFKTGADSSATPATGDIRQEEIPDILKSPPVMGVPPAATPPQAAPASHDSNPMWSSPDISREQKKLRQAWLAALILVLSGAAALLAFSFLQSPPAPPFVEQQATEGAAHSVAAPPLVKPEPAATAPKAQAELPENRLVVIATVPPQRAEPLPIAPPAIEQSEYAALPRTANGLKKQPAQTSSKLDRVKQASVAPEVPTQVPRQGEPVSLTNTPCSEAAQALSLCNLN